MLLDYKSGWTKILKISDKDALQNGGLTMKVIDKRTERNNDWNIGDVICFKNYGQSFKNFGMIVQEPISGRYSVVLLNGVSGMLSGDGYFSDQANIQYKEINRMIESFKDLWDCVEKVNAHLVVED